MGLVGVPDKEPFVQRYPAVPVVGATLSLAPIKVPEAMVCKPDVYVQPGFAPFQLNTVPAATVHGPGAQVLLAARMAPVSAQDV